MSSSRQLRILVIEDNPADVELARESLEEVAPGVELHVARDGVEAIEFLRRRGEFNQAPTPDLVLLDLNLPRKNGREVLREVKADPVLRKIPIVVFTGSDAEEDVRSSYELFANSYVTKPEHPGKISETMQAMMDFWFGAARLPTF